MVKLKILLDRELAYLRPYLETLGYEIVMTVFDVGLGQGERRKEIAEYANDNRLLLVTKDQVLVNLAEGMRVKYVLITNVMIAKLVDEEIREKYPEINLK